MKESTKKKLKFLIELGLCQNEINEILVRQHLLNQSLDHIKLDKKRREELKETEIN